VAETYTMAFWTTKAGAEDAFVEAWTEFAEWIKDQPGAGTMQLVRDLGDPSKFISFADWAGIEEIHRWKGTPEFREQIGRIKQHTDAFVPIEAELTVRVGKAAAVT
jgi:heme-degrading monooxygenase HmoA